MGSPGPKVLGAEAAMSCIDAGEQEGAAVRPGLHVASDVSSQPINTGVGMGGAGLGSARLATGVSARRCASPAPWLLALLPGVPWPSVMPGPARWLLPPVLTAGVDRRPSID